MPRLTEQAMQKQLPMMSISDETKQKQQLSQLREKPEYRLTQLSLLSPKLVRSIENLMIHGHERIA